MSMRDNKGGEADVDRFIKESVKSYRDCNVKNNARRNSLQKKTLGIESEWRIASAKLSKEERQLREQLKQMNIEKAKNHILHNMREPKSKKKPATVKEEHHIPTEPYPITFRDHSPGRCRDDASFEEAGRRYAAGERRRKSREFEDLSFNTHKGGSLFHIHEEDDAEPRRRVYSMSNAQRILAKGRKVSTGSQYSDLYSPRSSPSPRRKVSLGKKKGGNSASCSSNESMNDSTERITSLDDLHTLSEPEAIHSIRRPRKTVEEQCLEHQIHRLTIS